LPPELKLHAVFLFIFLFFKHFFAFIELAVEENELLYDYKFRYF